jgi:predicted transposase/invertase (TIGR01784 family)
MPRLNPLNDIAFTKCFGEPGCEPQTIGLLNAILERTGRDNITEVRIIPHKTLLPQTVEGKTSILDVHAKTADGQKFIVEVQRKNEYNMDKRTLFYWSREYIEGIDAGQGYQEVPAVVAINILDFSYLPIDEFHTSYHLWEDRHKDFLLTKAEEIHFIELSKFRKLAVKDIAGTPLHRWLSFLDPRTPEKTVEEIMQTDPVIEKAKTMMDEINKDEGLYHAYTLYQLTLMHEHDLKRGLELKANERANKRASKMASKMANKIVSRKVQVREREIALNFKAQGVPVEQIAAATGLSEEEIKEL